MKARKLALLFLILGFGALVETAYQLDERALGPTGCRVLTGRFQGPSFSYESETIRDGLPPELKLAVENAFGEVRVWQGEPGRVKLRLRKVVFVAREERARALADRLAERLTLEGDTLRVATNRRELEQSSDVGFETHLSLEVPPGTAVRVQNEHGASHVADAREASIWNSYEVVRVERVAGPADVDSRHGDVFVETVGSLKLQSRYGTVTVKGVAGPAELTVEHGDLSVSGAQGLKATLVYSDLLAEGLTGELEVHGRHAGVKARDVAGRTLVETTYRDVELQQLGGDARVKAEHTGVDAAELKGALSVETSYDEVRARDVAGPVEARVAHGGFRGERLRQGARIRASGEDVELSAFEGPVDIEAQRGAVRLDPEFALAEAVSVTTRRGGIELAVPAGSRFALDASAERGEIEVDVPQLEVSESSSSRLRGRLGEGGKTVTLRTQHGDIAVRAKTAAASAR